MPDPAEIAGDLDKPNPAADMGAAMAAARAFNSGQYVVVMSDENTGCRWAYGPFGDLIAALEYADDRDCQSTVIPLEEP